jgi:hypothetical protein
MAAYRKAPRRVADYRRPSGLPGVSSRRSLGSASASPFNSSAVVKSGFMSASAVKDSLELDQPRPGDSLDRERHGRADGEQRLGSRQRGGLGEMRQLVGAHPRQRGGGAAPLSHPLAFEGSGGEHALHYHPGNEAAAVHDSLPDTAAVAAAVEDHVGIVSTSTTRRPRARAVSANASVRSPSPRDRPSHTVTAHTGSPASLPNSCAWSRIAVFAAA